MQVDSSEVRRRAHSRGATPSDELFTNRGVAMVCAFAVLANAISARGVFLFWDDYQFLGQARTEPLDGAYLGEQLFSHFSPMTRLQMKVVAGLIDIDRSLVFWYMVGLQAFAVACIGFLMVVLFGRGLRAVVGIVLAGMPLAVVPAVNWVTAGLNLLPALGLSALCLATATLMVRTRNGWWGAACLGAYTLAVLDYEIAILMPMYVGLWVLISRPEVDGVGAAAVIRRTWWLWAGFFVVGLASVINYLANYYASTPGSTLPQTFEALRISLLETLLPSLIGVHRPADETLTAVAAVASGATTLALVVWSVRRSPRAWWAWGFALLGWLVPTVALVSNRAGLYGVDVARNMIYYPFATLFVVIGALQAVSMASTVTQSARAPAGTHTARGMPTLSTTGRVSLAGLALVPIVIAYATSVEPSLAQQAVARPARDYVANIEASARDVSGGAFTILDVDVPGELVPPAFAPFNRLSRVLSVNSIDLGFDDPMLPLYAPGPDGRLAPSTYTPLATKQIGRQGTPGRAKLTDALPVDGSSSDCFTTSSETRIKVSFPTSVAAIRLVVRVIMQVDTASLVSVRLLDPANSTFQDVVNESVLEPGHEGILVSTPVTTASQVILSNFTPGSEICPSSISLGVVNDNTRAPS